jgi:hypothetical protein
VLYVNGAPVDQAMGIWVDAGQSVSCSFAFVFTSIGSQQVQVRLEHIVPGDYDDRNNDSPVHTIDITPPVFSWYAYAYEGTNSRFSEFMNDWQTLDGTRGEKAENSYSSFQQTQYATLSASGYLGLSFPLHQLRISMSSGGSVIAQSEGSDVAPSWQYGDASDGSACLATGNDGAFFSLCSDWHQVNGQTARFTSVQYWKDASAATYFSHNYYHYWDPNANPPEGVYVSDETGSYSTGVPSIWRGEDITFSVTVEAADRTFSVAPVVALQPFDYSYDTGRYCWDYTFENAPGRSCARNAESGTGRTGVIFGTTP